MDMAAVQLNNQSARIYIDEDYADVLSLLQVCQDFRQSMIRTLCNECSLILAADNISAIPTMLCMVVHELATHFGVKAPTISFNRVLIGNIPHPDSSATDYTTISEIQKVLGTMQRIQFVDFGVMLSSDIPLNRHFPNLPTQLRCRFDTWEPYWTSSSLSNSYSWGTSTQNFLSSSETRSTCAYQSDTN